ncbi:hypothetical protein SAMN06269185_2145 [Natronoarchaeum philippinense]|uniref:Flagellin N-terminal-like domain-containing protein n=1 Tax=Natronoarchaeum philippinense TaxID=558529 RepID=A0A285NWG0_NATPI|nr:hypothetical protein [Natronoarchaeum philippinense]SNZ13377.1 hypothetical protein SAMN06269185_2145 [Natronoarchaeum philippinense]
MIGPDREQETAADRAVSDVLAFTLVFSIIITSVGLVYVFGMGALGDAQVSEQNRNAERAFETITVSFNDLQDGRGEERLSQLNPRGGRISVEESPTVTISAGGSAIVDADGDPIADRAVGSLNYAHEGTTISYELGAAFRADEGNSVLIRPPEFVCTTSGSGSDRAVLSYPNLASTQPSSVSTSSTLRIRATSAPAVVTRSTASDLTIEIEDSTHADAWARYFEDNGWTDVDGPSGSTGDVEATCDTDVTYVRETGVEVDLL